MHIQKVIEGLGFDKAEAKVYLAALTLGESTIADLARHLKSPRTTVQTIVRRLEAAGLLNPYRKRRRQYWLAENPDKLLIHLREREAALKTILPVLQAMRHDTGAKPSVRFYVGVPDIRRMMNDVIEEKRHIKAIVAWDDWRSLFGRGFVDDFVELRVQHFLKIRVITPRTPTSLALRKRDDQENRQTRFLGQNVMLKTSNFFYGDKTAIISLNRKSPIGILIDDADIAHTMELLFENLWSQCTD